MSSAPRRAYVTLLTTDAYGKGVLALQRSLVAVEAEYPLVVMVTPSVGAEVRASLAADGCELREVAPLELPAGVGGAPSYAVAYFAECWVKLRMWEWEGEFEQICYLDADMLVIREIDRLLDEPLAPATAADDSNGPPRVLRAVQECFCPVVERRHLCAYRCPTQPPPLPYFNAGLLVLRPCRATFAAMRAALCASDLSRFAFAEQDFLNEYFAGAWQPLPWVYNASKALYASHRDDVWDYGQARNLHYTMAKPWDLKHPCHKGYEKLNELWYAGFSNPESICRLLLQLHKDDKRRRAELPPGGASAANGTAAAILEAAPEGAPG